MNPGKVLVLIPTTSGTGSEVTSVAVLTDPEDHKKKGIGGPNVRATLAIIDPTLTLGMPPSITADTGMDVLAHAAEALTANRANMIADTLGEKAIAMVVENLPKAVKNGADMDARSQMSFAATLGGWSFGSSNTQLGHAFGHALGSLYHMPHGNACGVALPEIMDFIADAAPDGMKKVAAAMGLRVEAGASPARVGELVRDAMVEFSARIGQKTLKQFGIKEAALPGIAKAISTEFLVASAPKKVTEEDILTILQKAYAR
jgi:alcohol dehydrogenase